MRDSSVLEGGCAGGLPAVLPEASGHPHGAKACYAVPLRERQPTLAIPLAFSGLPQDETCDNHTLDACKSALVSWHEVIPCHLLTLPSIINMYSI